MTRLENSLNALTLGCCLATIVLSGCNRTYYRRQADQEAYEVIREHAYDPQYAAESYSIDMDPRSRYFEPYNQDCPPMPEDDPESHRYMRRVNGIKGWKHWYNFGQRDGLENPVWRERLREYVEVAGDGTVRLTPESALRLAYIHSPDHQGQLETMYLSSIDVITERFRLETQFFGGYDAVYQHVGSKAPGGETNTLSIGRGAGALPAAGVGGGTNALQLNRRFATAGTLVVGLANSFVWEFTQGDVNFASSLLSASFVQPLLRSAGKDVALEQLTIVERALLGNVRQYHLFRQGMYTEVNIGEGAGGLQRRGGFFGGTGLTGFTGQGAGGFGGVGFSTFGGGGFFGGGGGGGNGAGFAGGGAGTIGGYLGLLQQLQQIRNSQDSLRLQLRTLRLLEAHLEAGVIDLTQVDQFRQSIETERATLLQNQNGLEFSLESYKTGTLGLPPDLPIELDDTMIRQFQLVAPKATDARDVIANIKDRLGELADDASVESLQQIFADAEKTITVMRSQFEDVDTDLQRMETTLPARTRQLTDTEQRLLDNDLKLLQQSQNTLKDQLTKSLADFGMLRDQLNAGTVKQTAEGLVKWLNEFYRLSQGSILVQARGRLEAVTIEPILINSDDAFKIAVDNRVDLKNARAALVDAWRLIAFNADALQSNVSVSFSGNMGTVRDNALSFDGSDSTLRAGLQFDAPFTRVLERNNYRQQLITYQQARRRMIRTYDGIHQGMRGLLRQIEQLRLNLEIQRRAVAIAIRRVDMTRESLNAPVPPPLPGQPPAQFGPTAATNLLTALSDLRNAQNNFMSVWLNYYAARMRLVRELGIMRIDERGEWIDEPIPTNYEESLDGDAECLPPGVPQEWMESANVSQEQINEIYGETSQSVLPEPHSQPQAQANSGSQIWNSTSPTAQPRHNQIWNLPPTEQHEPTQPRQTPSTQPTQQSDVTNTDATLPQASLSVPILDR